MSILRKKPTKSLPKHDSPPIKRRRRSGVSCTPLIREKKVYKIGVCLKEWEPVHFVVTCHDFQYRGSEANFFNYGNMGAQEFDASFKHVIYVVLEDEKKEDPIEDANSLPANFGQLT